MCGCADGRRWWVTLGADVGLLAPLAEGVACVECGVGSCEVGFEEGLADVVEAEVGDDALYALAGFLLEAFVLGWDAECGWGGHFFDVKMWGCGDVQMWGCGDVQIVAVGGCWLVGYVGCGLLRIFRNPRRAVSWRSGRSAGAMWAGVSPEMLT